VAPVVTTRGEKSDSGELKRGGDAMPQGVAWAKGASGGGPSTAGLTEETYQGENRIRPMQFTPTLGKPGASG